MTYAKSYIRITRNEAVFGYGELQHFLAGGEFLLADIYEEGEDG